MTTVFVIAGKLIIMTIIMTLGWMSILIVTEFIRQIITKMIKKNGERKKMKKI